MDGGNVIRWIARALTLLAAWVSLAPPAAALAGAPLTTCYRRALPDERAAAVLSHPRGFDCTGDQRAAGPGDYWVLAPRLPAMATDSLIRSASVWQDAATLHVRYADGAVRSTGFTSATAWQRLKLGAVFELALPPHPARATALLWHVRGAPVTRGIVIDPRVATPAQSTRMEVAMAGFYAAFAGLCVALLMSNLALGAALRQRFHPPYCAMVLCLLAYGVSSSGLLGQLTGMDNNLRLRLNTALLSLALSFAILFARRFFHPRVFAGWVGRAATLAVGAVLVTATLYCALMPWAAHWLDAALTASFAAAAALALPLLWRGWRADTPHARVFMLAWGSPFVLAGLRIAQAAGLVRWNFFIDNSTLLAMALEASCSALVIAWRIKLVVEERDAAREQEMLARLLADSDPLTGLMNRRSFLREAIGRADAQLLVLIDIDHFKLVNDTLGHDGGDEVLRTFARALLAVVPDDALVARVGGEEFAVLARAGLDALPDQILGAVRAARMPFDLTVTASLGSERGTIATEAEWKRLYRRADDALYAAKTAGRDRARWAAAA
ncbi:GGDEF domain-containing protein [Sphingomonas sp. RHCKR7]|uniref:GGDEF domain-containing protein n=1 Tax=Sphingomonas folli TaxID=2862497 RepID=UPI001C6849BD|nr:diguanylate cyclase [Sphingomonas folli]MBW6526916.1 GGDEF domain-containing protein [Sphingomonas folli]